MYVTPTQHLTGARHAQTAQPLHPARCLADFGFLTLRAGRGISLMTCGLVLLTDTRYLVAVLEATGHAPLDSSIVETVAGAFAVAVGLINTLFSLVPQCCVSVALPPDALTTRFGEIHIAARQAKVTKGLTTTLASAPKLDVITCDVEKGRGSPDKKRSNVSTPTKRMLTPTKRMAKTPAGVETVIAATLDNPFLTRPVQPASQENPFMTNMQIASRC